VGFGLKVLSDDHVCGTIGGLCGLKDFGKKLGVCVFVGERFRMIQIRDFEEVGEEVGEEVCVCVCVCVFVGE
jgi:hypothetical protein